MMITNL